MNKHDAIYLNTFDVAQVLEVYDEIVLKNIVPINCNLSISREIAIKCKFLSLTYEPMFNLIYLYEYDGKQLFPNPNCTCLIASNSDFMAALKPNELYYKLIKPSPTDLPNNSPIKKGNCIHTWTINSTGTVPEKKCMNCGTISYEP